MIAPDTNILLRFLLQDDSIQAIVATQLIEGQAAAGGDLYISLPVLCELVWTLQRHYRFPRETTDATIVSLLASDHFRVQHEDAVRAAIGSKADVADALVHELGRIAGCAETVTFDRRFARLDGVRLIA